MSVPTFVQSNAGGALGGGNLSVSLAYTSAQTAGNSNVICFSLNNVSVVSVTDTSGNVYSAVNSRTSSGNWTSYVYTSFRIAASAPGANFVKITYSASLTFPELNILEYSNCGGVEASAVAAGTSTTPTSPNISPARANDLLLGYGFPSSGSPGGLTAGSGYTIRQQATIFGGVEDQLSPGTSPIDATFSLGASHTWAVIFVVITPPVTAIPTCTPIGGHYDYATVVRMSCSSPSPSIYYTLDGSVPTTGSTLYSGPVALPASGAFTLSMMATSSGLVNSLIGTAQFYLQQGGLWNVVDDQFDITTGTRVRQYEGNIMYDPVSGYWFKYGQSDVDFSQKVYRSADLLNWQSLGNISLSIGGGRIYCIYNALNQNYVLWVDYANSPTNSKASYVASSPAGPFTLANQYDTWQSINIDTGDSSAFVDPATGIGYFITECNSNTDLMVIQLSADYLSLTNTYALTTASDGEAPTMWYNGPGNYFLMMSAQSGFSPNGCTYQHASSPLGPWSPYPTTNPFQAASIPQTPGEIAASITATNSNSYDTQTCQVLFIPGRNLFLYYGDRYDGGGTPFTNYRKIVLPVAQAATTMTISWTASWNMNTVAPTISGAPTPAEGPYLSGNVATWFNTYKLAANVYLDIADDSGFTTNVRSEVLGVGASSFTITAPGNFYRIRTVNVNGFALSFLPGTMSASFTPPSISAGFQSAGLSLFFQSQGLTLNVPNSSISLKVPNASISLIVP